MIFLANLTRVLLLGIGLMVAGCGLKFSDDEAAKATAEPNKVTLSTKLVETGDIAKPYAVQVDVATKEYADLYLVKTNDLAALIAQGQKLSKTVGTQSAAEVTNLAAIDKAQFSFTDQNVNPRSKVYYAVVQIVGEAVPAPDQLAGKAGMPAPVGVEIPALTVAVAVSQQIDSDQILANKVFFAPSPDNQRLLKQENGVITQTITIPAGDVEYIDNAVSFEKNYRYTLEVLDSSGAILAVHDSNTATYNWPVLDLSSDAVIKLAVDEKTALHNYEYVFEDLTKFKPILQLQSSTDGVSFSDATVLTDVASVRKWVALKTAPEKLKFRVQQLNRSGLPISTSPVKELVIPKDLQVTGAVTAAAIATNNKIENIGRLHLANATITLGSSPLEITATKLISDASKIVAFSAPAAYNTTAASAGALKINAQTATGTLEVDLRGQQGFSGLKGLKGTKGATGSTGTNGIAPTQTSYWNKGACDVENPNICPCDKAGSTNPSSASFYPTNAGYVPTSGGPGGTGGQGSPGYSGEAGGNSGASGSLTYEVQTDELTKTFNVTARIGGNGGEGGDGGDGGNGGAGGNPGPYWCTDGKGTKNFTWPYYWPSSRNPPFAGATGSVGAVGPKGVQGPNGQPGTAGQICEKIGTQPQRCY